MVRMRLNCKQNRYTKQQQEQQKVFVSYYKINNLLHVLDPYFINTLLYLDKFLSVIPVPLTTALKGSSAM
ncbi:hypothetical protein GCM10023330_22620 [Litoribaculum gwangyangense]|uniref:Uncharacterized protein n=1 Tax=Litoribaculum gwangyangense TaxID=1130722 RepID=A0ABP9CNN0_9FLAO